MSIKFLDLGSVQCEHCVEHVFIGGISLDEYHHPNMKSAYENEDIIVECPKCGNKVHIAIQVKHEYDLRNEK